MYSQYKKLIQKYIDTVIKNQLLIKDVDDIHYMSITKCYDFQEETCGTCNWKSPVIRIKGKIYIKRNGKYIFPPCCPREAMSEENDGEWKIGHFDYSKFDFNNEHEEKYYARFLSRDCIKCKCTINPDSYLFEKSKLSDTKHSKIYDISLKTFENFCGSNLGTELYIDLRRLPKRTLRKTSSPLTVKTWVKYYTLNKYYDIFNSLSWQCFGGIKYELYNIFTLNSCP